MKRLLVSQPLLPEVEAEFQPSAVDVTFRAEATPMTAEELRDCAGSYDGLVTLLTDRIDSEFLTANPQLKVVSNVAVGFDNIDVTAAKQRGVIVTNTPDVLTETTADLAWALLLSAARRVPEADQYMREGRYERWEVKQPHLGVDVFGQRLGILGMGKIGQAVARRGFQGFGMEVLYHDVVRRPPEFEAQLGIRYVEFDELIQSSDFLSLHAPLTPDTKHVIDADALSRMQAHAILINTARGPLIDEQALAEALEQGHIRGAALDVYEHEPRINERLRVHRTSTVLLPHLGSATRRTRLEMCRMALTDALRVLNGEAPLHPVPS